MPERMDNFVIHEYYELFQKLIAQYEHCSPFYWEILLPVINRYHEPWRHYHTIAHIVDGLAKFRSLKEYVADPAVTLISWLYHDAVYVPGSNENEYCSAMLARADLARMGLPDEMTERVYRNVLATDHAVTDIPDDANGNDLAIMLDVDFSSLGDPKDKFITDGERLWREHHPRFSHDVYDAQRATWARGLLGPKPIFLTPHFSHLEERARENLTWALQVSFHGTGSG